jgi:hypothetical protein
MRRVPSIVTLYALSGLLAAITAQPCSVVTPGALELTVAKVQQVERVRPKPASPQWEIVPSPSLTRVGQTRLNAISCVSGSLCFAVGATTATSPAIEKLSRGSWKIMHSPTPTDSQLNGVSCATSTRCVAVGWDSPPAGESAFIVQLLAGNWKSVPTPGPGGGPSALEAVSCASATACVAVGYSQTSTLIEVLNAGTWTVMPSPNSPAPSNNLNGVSCADPSDCVAVGQYDDSLGDHTLIEQLSGGVWSIVPAPDVTRLNSVSCSTSSSCVAVGNTNIEQLVSGTWQIMSAPSAGNFESVSCFTSSVCTAVGQTAPGTSDTLVEQLSAGIWSVLRSPSVSDASASVLLGVSYHLTCNASGFYQVAGADVYTLAERN